MTDLITRLEQAEAGSRSLDAEIWYALIEKWGGHPDRDMIGRWPAYTTSLDAITALIGEKLPGWTWEVVSYGAACLLSPDNREAIAAQGRGKTPVLALCIALLRAIKEGEHG